MSIPAIDGDRLWNTLMEMAHFGATPKGGVCRLALTDEDKAARDLFSRWCAEAGCSVTVDRMGNVFARRSGRDDALPPVVMGSHLDSQPTGGKFDGAYGGLAALEVVRALNDAGYETTAPIEVVAWTNEEGSRFPPSMVASGVFAGKFSLAEAHAQTDPDGITLGDELVRIGYAGEEEVGKHPVHAYFEAHIEQGPALDTSGEQIGVVTDIVGIRDMKITFDGQQNHAGTTPMHLRRDAFQAVSAFNAALNDRLRNVVTPQTVWTIGHVALHPNASSIVPGRAVFSMQWRDADADRLGRMEQIIRDTATEIAAQQGLTVSFGTMLGLEPVAMDPVLRTALEAGAEEVAPGNWRKMPSGALHDATNVSRKMPVAMLFVPSIGGLSHTFEEDTDEADLAAGVQVLARAVTRLGSVT